MKKNPTIIDVAQQAGVSPSTVSRVFDPSWNGRIREETRRIVLKRQINWVITEAMRLRADCLRKDRALSLSLSEKV